MGADLRWSLVVGCTRHQTRDNTATGGWSVFTRTPCSEAYSPIRAASYYARKTRWPSQRSVRDAELSDKIVDLHKKHRSVYGLRKLWKAAIRDDIDIGRDHLARLMSSLGLKGVVRGKTKRTTIVDEQAARPADLVDRQSRAAEPNRLWVTDITYSAQFTVMCSSAG